MSKLLLHPTIFATSHPVPEPGVVQCPGKVGVSQVPSADLTSLFSTPCPHVPDSLLQVKFQLLPPVVLKCQDVLSLPYVPTKTLSSKSRGTFCQLRSSGCLELFQLLCRIGDGTTSAEDSRDCTFVVSWFSNDLLSGFFHLKCTLTPLQSVTPFQTYK